MDGNETSSLNDRVQIDNQSKLSFSGNNSPNARTIDRYSKNFINCHRQKNPSLYSTENRDLFSYNSYSNCQPGPENKTIHSSIDYTLITKDLAAHVTSCAYTDEVKNWGGGTRKFHKATITHICLPPSPRPTSVPIILQGRTINPGPNLKNLTPATESELSRKVEQKLLESWKTIKEHTKGNSKLLAKRDMLLNVIKKVINTTVEEVLGKPKTKPTHTTRKRQGNSDSRAKRLIKRVGHVLKLTRDTIYHDPSYPKPLNLNDELIQSDIAFLTNKNFPIPTTTQEWVDWWPRRYTILKDNLPPKTTAVKDCDFLKDPKRTYRLCCKPNANTKVTALIKDSKIITSDWEIEKELTEYIKTICGNGQENLERAPPPPPLGKTASTRPMNTSPIFSHPQPSERP